MPLSKPAKDNKLAAIRRIIQSLKPLVVAYSGGVDSTLIAKLATLEIGEKSLVAIADSPSLPRRELTAAIYLAKKHGFNLKVIATKEMENQQYRENSTERCYFCKKELYGELTTFLTEGYQAILDGTNLDDLGDIRPGQRAAKEKGVRSLLVEAKLDKQEVRQAAKKLGLENWNKPAAACLSSRIPHGITVEENKLSKIEQAEDFLLSLGLKQVRVRHHDKIARLEVLPGDFDFILDNRVAIHRFFSDLGYWYTSLDIQGFRSGSLNKFK